MGRLLNVVTPLHKMTKRDYLARMVDERVHCMGKAKEYETDYWDGDRRYGYGGYRYLPGRWKPVAQALIDLYGLKRDARILDVGCGKGFLLYEFKELLPDAHLVGVDNSRHGLADAKPEVRDGLFRYKAQAAILTATAPSTSWPLLGRSTTSKSSNCRRRSKRSSGSAAINTSWSRATVTILRTAKSGAMDQSVSPPRYQTQRPRLP
jgi:hypothetical protein